MAVIILELAVIIFFLIPVSLMQLEEVTTPFYAIISFILFIWSLYLLYTVLYKFKMLLV